MSLLLYNQSSYRRINATAGNWRLHLSATNKSADSTPATIPIPQTKSADPDPDPDSLGMIVAFSVLGFLLFDVAM